MTSPIHPDAGSSPGADDRRTVRAVVQRDYGTDPSAVLRVDRIAAPVALGGDDVRVRVEAVSIDRGTWHLMAGLPRVARVALGVRRPKALNPALAFAGTVEQVGPTVTALRAGDQVYGTAGGALAELVSARASRVAVRPATVSVDAAAATPISGCTALQAVRDHAKVVAGHRVLVIGASGGVGSFAVQIAKAVGADVTGVCRTDKVDFVRGLGADRVIDYTAADLHGTGPYDAIIDTGGNRSLSLLRGLLAPRGRLVIVGGEGDGPWLGGLDRQLRAMLLSPFVGQRLGTFVASETVEDLDALRELIDGGKVSPAVDRTYPLEETPAAIQHLIDGHVRGKVVVKPSL